MPIDWRARAPRGSIVKWHPGVRSLDKLIRRYQARMREQPAFYGARYGPFVTDLQLIRRLLVGKPLRAYNANRPLFQKGV